MLVTVEVANVRCGGCAATITKALEAEGFTEINVDLSCDPRKVTAEISDETREELFKTTLRKLGYPLSDETIDFVDAAGLKAKSVVSCAVGKLST